MNEKNENYISTEEKSSQNKPTREGFMELIKEKLIKINKVSKGEDEGKENKKH